LASGNFYGVLPYEGRYDALVSTWFSYERTANTFSVQEKFVAISGEARDQKWVNIADGKKMLAVARNNESLLFYKPLDK